MNRWLRETGEIKLNTSTSYKMRNENTKSNKSNELLGLFGPVFSFVLQVSGFNISHFALLEK